MISILEGGLNNAELRQTILAVLALLQENGNASITEHQTGGTAKGHILGIYRTRQKHLSKRGITLPGFDETVLSLSKCDSETINLVSIKVADKLIAIWLTPSMVLAGCFIGKDHRDAEE